MNVNNYEYCEKCFCKWHCAGDCPSKIVSVDIEKIERGNRCEINQELTKDLIIDLIRNGSDAKTLGGHI